MQTSDLVRAELVRRFGEPQATEIAARFDATRLPNLEVPNRQRERDRVHLAVIKLANGDASTIDRHLAIAAEDWRDTLVASGLGHGNWPEILAAAGFPVP